MARQKDGRNNTMKAHGSLITQRYSSVSYMYCLLFFNVFIIIRFAFHLGYKWKCSVLKEFFFFSILKLFIKLSFTFVFLCIFCLSLKLPFYKFIFVFVIRYCKGWIHDFLGGGGGGQIG